MWTAENRAHYDRSRLRYPSDLTDEEWALIEPCIPPAKRGGNKRTVNLREVANGLMYILSTGCDVVTRTLACIRLSGKMAYDDLVCPPSFPACGHPARRLAVYAFHAQLSRRRRSASGARFGYLLRNGAPMGIEVRAVVRQRTSPSTPTANIALASRRECAAYAPAAMEVRRCIEDEGGPLGADHQG